MRELDIVEHRLKTQIQTATEGLQLVSAMRKMLGGDTPAAAPKTNGSGKNGKVANRAGVTLSPAIRRKQRDASKAYWAKVKSGEIKRKGYKADAQQ